MSDVDLRLISLYQDDWIRKYLSVASYTCLVYDHALTFDQEVEFVWHAPWSFTKAIFLFNRYGNLVCQTIIQLVKLIGIRNHGGQSCDLPAVFTATYMVFAIESVHILVILRAWAIWGCERWVAIMLIASYTVYLLFFLVKAIFDSMAITIRTFQYTSLPEVCVTVVPSKMWVLCVANICQDSAVFIITMTSLLRHARSTPHLYPTSLLFLLIRDAVIFYTACLFFHGFGAAVCIAYSSNPKNVLFRTFALNLVTIAGQRFVLNLRRFAVRSYGSRSLSMEVDRQLRILNLTQPEGWWSTGASAPRSDGSPDGRASSGW